MGNIKIMVDYSIRDGKEVPETLVDYLRNLGYTVWWDQDLDYGVPWASELVSRVHNCDLLITFVGDFAGDSNWVRRILDIARGADTSLLPIFYGNDTHSFEIGDKLFINDIQRLQYDKVVGWENYPKLIPSIERLSEMTRTKRLLRYKSLIDPNKHGIFGAPTIEEKYIADIFVMMPFKEPFVEIYNNHLKAVSDEMKLSIKKADNDVFGSKDIMHDVWSLTFNCRFVVADCTERNPNVFYEMGIAHTLGKTLIPITQKEEDIPFDIRQRRYIKYDFTPSGMKKFEAELKKAIERLSAETK